MINITIFLNVKLIFFNWHGIFFDALLSFQARVLT